MDTIAKAFAGHRRSILQVNNNELPSHITAPAVHKSLGDVADHFNKVLDTPRKTEIAALTREAREVLRDHPRRAWVLPNAYVELILNPPPE